MSRSLIGLVLVLFLVKPCFGVDLVLEDEEDIEDLLLLGEISYSEYLELRWLIDRGLDLNAADIDEFLKIPGIGVDDIERIIEFRKRFGPFTKIEELMKVPGIDDETYRRLLPFVRIFHKEPIRFKGRLRSRIVETLDDDRTPKLYNQMRLFYDENVQGLISMRDGLTTYRYVRLEDVWIVDRIDVGNYYAGFGQRLVFGSRFDGVMCGLRFGPIKPSIIYSYTDGERVEGVNLDVSIWRHDLGIGYLRSVEREIYGVHLGMPILDLGIYSGYAKVIGGGEGFLVSGRLNQGPITLSSSYRSYASDFDNPYSDGFAEDDDRDEVGIYLGIEYRFSPHFRIKASQDHWHHPSTLVRNSNSGIKLYWNLSNTTRLRIFREWDDDDIERDGGRRRKTSFEINLKPKRDLGLSLYLRATERDEDLDGFGRLRISYQVLDGLWLEGYLRLKDTRIYKEGGSSTRYHIQLKDRLTPLLSILGRYTNTTYNDDYEGLNPRHEYMFCLDVVW